MANILSFILKTAENNEPVLMSHFRLNGTSMIARPGGSRSSEVNPGKIAKAESDAGSGPNVPKISLTKSLNSSWLQKTSCAVGAYGYR